MNGSGINKEKGVTCRQPIPGLVTFVAEGCYFEFERGDAQSLHFSGQIGKIIA